MADINIEKLSLLPEEMLSFTLLTSIQRAGPRLGQLALRERSKIATPHYIANTSRGVVPHISQDNLVRHCKLDGLYLGLEDCTWLFDTNVRITQLTHPLILKQ